MGTDQIMYCIVALILGMLLANMLKNVCGCKNVVEGSKVHGSKLKDYIVGLDGYTVGCVESSLGRCAKFPPFKCDKGKIAASILSCQDNRPHGMEYIYK